MIGSHGRTRLKWRTRLWESRNFAPQRLHSMPSVCSPQCSRPRRCPICVLESRGGCRGFGDLDFRCDPVWPVGPSVGLVAPSRYAPLDFFTLCVLMLRDRGGGGVRRGPGPLPPPRSGSGRPPYARPCPSRPPTEVDPHRPRLPILATRGGCTLAGGVTMALPAALALLSDRDPLVSAWLNPRKTPLVPRIRKTDSRVARISRA